MFPVDAGIDPRTLRRHTLKAGAALADRAAIRPSAAAPAITVTVDATFIRSREDEERHFEVRVGNVETKTGGRQVFGGVARAATDIEARRSLNSVELVPPDVLSHLGRVIECEPPRIASIRAFYRRRRTLFEHQAAARALLRRSEVSEHGLRGLTAFLRREAVGIYNSMDLAAKARVWLIDHGYLLPTEREIH